MPPGDLAATVLSTLASTIEVDATPRLLDVSPEVQASLVNAGTTPVHIFFKSTGAIPTDGLEAEGYVELSPNDTFPMMRGQSIFRYRTASGAGKLWYAPVSA